MCSVLIHGFVDMLFFQSPEFNTMFWIVVALTVANELRRPAGNTSSAASYGVEA